MASILSVDLGTGGAKVCLFDESGERLFFAVEEYATEFPYPEWQEQDPNDWLKAILNAAKKVQAAMPQAYDAVCTIALSGYSLGAIPVDEKGELLVSKTPIWSDGRAENEAKAFFEKVDFNEWYLETGNGFPSRMYAAFKIRWYKNHMPEVYHRAKCFLGTKDYVNLWLCGVFATDHSYASGSGVYNLKARAYDPELVEKMGIDGGKLPKIVPSTKVLGTLLPETCELLHLREGVCVVAGGVDNACMALGAACYRNGDVYTSLGTSAWVAVSSDRPVVDIKTLPYVFEHCIPGQYVSAACMMSAGRSLQWARDEMCRDLKAQAKEAGISAYDLMTECASHSLPGARGLLFNPSLSGGGTAGAYLRGALFGLDLGHTRDDGIRAVLEGISMDLRVAMDALSYHTPIGPEMLIVGGGAKSAVWRQIFADVFEKKIRISNVDQDAGALGAAVLATIGAGLWNDASMVDGAHKTLGYTVPDEKNVLVYQKLLKVYIKATLAAEKLAEDIREFQLSLAEG